MDNTSPRGAVAWTSTAGASTGDFVIPAGTVTLLLADIEGSTRGWERDATSMDEAVVRMHELVDGVVATHGGVRPVEQGEGDSFVAAFSTASDALHAAADMQQALAAGPLRVRIGIHTGEVQVRDGVRYVGSTVNRTARLRDIGHGGQVLVSRATADVASTLPDGYLLVELGAHRLRDLGAPLHVLQLTRPGVDGPFPPLRSLDTHTHNLPVALTTFIGREAELTEVADLTVTSRLVTLTGAGGSGKTRLAQQVAASVLDRYSGGTWFCDLSPVSDPDGVAGELAATLAVALDPSGTAVDALVHRLGSTTTLVILDNCEHVVDAVALLARELLRTCTGLTVLATSREPLGIAGEVAWRVPPLGQAGDRATSSIEVLSHSDAFTLFVDRAVAARPSFEVSRQNAPAIAEICARLDGMPLAIELAAARVRVLTVEEIAGGLNDRFRLLGSGGRTALPRQQTLAASVAWSHDLLTAQQQALFRRLSVFIGGFDLSAAEHVAADAVVPTEDILEVLAQLIDRSLVVMEDHGARARYRLLETIRLYAADRLADAGEVTTVRARHLSHFAARAASWYALPKQQALGPDAEARRDEANIRTALQWAASAELPGDGVVLARAVVDLWCAVRGRGGELDTWLERLLTVDGADDRTIAVAWLTRAAIASWRMDALSAMTAATNAAAAAASAGDELLAVEATARLAQNRVMTDYDGGVADLDRAIAVFDEHGRGESPTAARWYRAYWTAVGGSSGEALRRLADLRSGRDASSDGDQLVSGMWHLAEGIARLNLGELAAARDALGESISELDDAGSWFWRRGAGAFDALAAVAAGDLESAQERIRGELAAIGEREPYPALPAQLALVLVNLSTGDVGAAVDAGRSMAAAWPDFLWLGRAAHAVAVLVESIAAADGDMNQAVEGARRAVELAGTCHYPFASGLVHVGASSVLRRAGHRDEAERSAHGALAELAAGDVRILVPSALEALAGIELDTGDPVVAVRLLGAASALRAAAGRDRSPIDTPTAPADIAAAHAALDDDTFAAAWSEGTALSLETAIEYVTRGRGTRKRPSFGWASLTPAEEAVVSLVELGLSNPEIAERLFISRKTVASHLAHVFTKLDVTSRAELAANAARRR